MKNVSKKIDSLNLKIALLYDQIRRIQDSCPHPNASKKPISNSGDWDYATTKYWYECRCPDCSKFWREPQ